MVECVPEEIVMPLRDHFRPPLAAAASWEELHEVRPMVIVRRPRTILPPGDVAGPRAHATAQVAMDVAAYERTDTPVASAADEHRGGAATARVAEPAVRAETGLPESDEDEVRVYDARRGRRLIAAVEIVSPANKDRPEKRNALIGKCAALLWRAAPSTSSTSSPRTGSTGLYAELMMFVGQPDPTMRSDRPHRYARRAGGSAGSRGRSRSPVRPRSSRGSRGRRCRYGWRTPSSCRSIRRTATSERVATCGSRDRRRNPPLRREIVVGPRFLALGARGPVAARG